MTRYPPNAKIYHITHIDNLPRIITSGGLLSDAECLRQGINVAGIASDEIKQERLHRRPVNSCPGTMVGQYVPFYFCPRSVLLYIAHTGNRPGYGYQAGQEPILHLQIDLKTAIDYVATQNVPWAFSDRNAALMYANFYSDPNQFNQLDWNAIATTKFSRRNGADIVDKKMAEFLIYNTVPWKLIEKIGVKNAPRETQVRQILTGLPHIPDSKVEQSWYYN